MVITNGIVVVSGDDNPPESSERQSKSPFNVNKNAKYPKQDIHKTVPNHDLEIDDDPLIDVSDTKDLVQETSSKKSSIDAENCAHKSANKSEQLQSRPERSSSMASGTYYAEQASNGMQIIIYCSCVLKKTHHTVHYTFV
ncbi:hypothetical protein DPMN_035819 [Dreissena polymorpha]|uniref:Uncharacterized protein n=1 Tax=Dreissena polymorpha TaxID=45954 RepID=A0A9D4M8A1_DREPO|nr:hypothetical protein DPMN_035819 [Dreissena polymorpha]